MKAYIEKFYRSKVALFSVVVFIVAASMVYAFSITDTDSDGDSVPNDVDLCVSTTVDKAGNDWGVNRYLWTGGSNFVSLVPDKGGKNQEMSDITIAQTKGCSCIDIVRSTDSTNVEKNNNYLNGCTRSTIEKWMKEHP